MLLSSCSGDLLLPEPESGNEPGDLTPIPTQVWNETNSTITSGSGMESGSGSDVPIPFREPHDITLESPGSSLLLYFFTDLAQEGTGFNLSYWLDNDLNTVLFAIVSVCCVQGKLHVSQGLFGAGQLQ